MRDRKAGHIEVADRKAAARLKRMERRGILPPIDVLRTAIRQVNGNTGFGRFRDRDQSTDVIGVLMSNQDGIEVFEILANRCQPAAKFTAAQTGIDQYTGTVRRDEGGVAGAAARQDADFKNERLPPLRLGRATALSLMVGGVLPFIPERFEQFPKNCFGTQRPRSKPYNKRAMTARVYVSIKPSVLDPQGKTICSALNGLGHKEIASVRQGKYFEVALADAVPPGKAAAMLDEIARDVLSNPVIEDYRVEILD